MAVMVQPSSRPRAEQLDKLKGVLAGVPVFILGNSPWLPIDSLPLLNDFFTIGVNRITQVYDPTILMIIDETVFKDVELDQIHAQKLFNCSMDRKYKTPETWLPDLVGASQDWGTSPGQIHANGNSGVAAAAWAATLGCEPIYLLGMEARYDGDRTDFYGVNRHHMAGVINNLQRMMKRLHESFAHCIDVTSPEQLKQIIETNDHHRHDRQYWMDELWRPMNTTV